MSTINFGTSVYTTSAIMSMLGMGGDDDTKETDGLLPTASPHVPRAIEPMVAIGSAGAGEVVDARGVPGRSAAALTYDGDEGLLDHKRVSVDGKKHGGSKRGLRHGRTMGFRQGKFSSTREWRCSTRHVRASS